MNVQGSWVPALWDAFKARATTRSAKDVLLSLRTFRGAGELIYPSHATLAARARCGVTTVKEALAAVRDADLVSWSSGRGRQTSNRYALELPAGGPAARQPRRMERTARALVAGWRREGENSFKKGLTGGHVLTPHPPMRTVAEQLAALMRPTGATEALEARQTLAMITTRRSAEREEAWRATRAAGARHVRPATALG